MKRITLAVCFVAFLLAMAGPAAAIVVDFNSFPNDTPIPNGYAGFIWSPNFYVVGNNFYNTEYGNSMTFPSPPDAAFNGFGVETVSVYRPSLFNLVGAYFSTWAFNNLFSSLNGSAYSLLVAGYNGTTLVGEVVVLFSPLYGTPPPPSFFYMPLGFNNINYVTFSTNLPGEKLYWLMDNLTYTAVPLPPSVLLLGSGLVGLLGFRRFRKH